MESRAAYCDLYLRVTFLTGLSLKASSGFIHNPLRAPGFRVQCIRILGLASRVQKNRVTVPDPQSHLWPLNWASLQEIHYGATKSGLA